MRLRGWCGGALNEGTSGGIDKATLRSTHETEPFRLDALVNHDGTTLVRIGAHFTKEIVQVGGRGGRGNNAIEQPDILKSSNGKFRAEPFGAASRTREG